MKNEEKIKLKSMIDTVMAMIDLASASYADKGIESPTQLVYLFKIKKLYQKIIEELKKETPSKIYINAINSIIQDLSNKTNAFSFISKN